MDSILACSGQHFWLALRRRSPLAIKQICFAFNVSVACMLHSPFPGRGELARCVRKMLVSAKISN
jgi:hypothetical protein